MADHNRFPAQDTKASLTDARSCERGLMPWRGWSDDEAERGFFARALLMATLPHSKPQATEIERRNGTVTVKIIAHDKTLGLPYGTYPRLLLAWMCTEATRRRQRELPTGGSLAEFLARIGIASFGGKTRQLVSQQLLRLACVTISLRSGRATPDQKCDIVNFVPITRYSVHEQAGQHPDLFHDIRQLFPDVPEFTATPGWYSRVFPEKIVLTHEFFQEIINHPVPVSLDALREIHESPLAIDVYLWLHYRLFYASNTIRLSWQQLHEQFGASFKRPRAFREKVLGVFRTIAPIVGARIISRGNLLEIERAALGRTGVEVVPARRGRPRRRG